MKTAIFLGAGASKAEGIPVQDELLKLYFRNKSREEFFRGSNLPFSMEDTLASFFKIMFDIDVFSEDTQNQDFPSFEEIIGILELAEMRRETLNLDRLFPCMNKKNNYVGLQSTMLPKFLFSNLENHLVRLYIIILISKVLAENTNSSRGYHLKLIQNLKRAELLRDVVIITTNYDTLIDNAIINSCGKNHIDYGVEFCDTRPHSHPQCPEIKLFKIHGSLNWLFCPSCSNLKLTPISTNGIKLVTGVSEVICSKCNSFMLPVIVPPSYFKDMSNAFLSTIWNKTENILKEVEGIIFCGYSFCESDIHIKYLIKKVQLSKSQNMKFTVINNYPDKTADSIMEEKNRYKRFLGNSVIYSRNTFIDFVENPLEFLY